jgi:glutamate dehydrogenase
MLHDFEMAVATKHVININQVRDGIEEAFLRVWSGGMESDGFNKLVAFGGLGWREVVILRAYAKYLRQAAFRFSQSYIEDALAAHPHIAALLAKLFLTAFDPALHTAAKSKKSEANVTKTRNEITSALEHVSSADEDRILRRYLNLIDCTLRTNYFQTGEDGEPKSYVSFKLNSQGIEELPLPRPMVEVFVYSPRVEAIHLRGGKVARGGLRWSDRREDFRSEILGLVKAQMVKNAVIVPTGSKGGFVVKQPPAIGGREAMQQEGIECYKTLQRGLLDITDNIVKDKIAPPARVVRRDEDDPYLVVAADKGTATFSDIANGVSEDYGFWLGDAYASGGSVGYDHKAMGITARGAWESVKRHFREIGVNTQSEDFTCIGVGDMSGDVFGNGMLLSKHIKLVAAFNHLHIFIDPDPDSAKSYVERGRLFKLPRSTWADYNSKLISKGGGVFDRSAKSLKLTPQIKSLLELSKSEVTPTELITAILKSRTDLLFFGGIGTYIKGSGESHADASDRANDALRINGRELRVKVIGEGANLGITQRARIEAAGAGVRLNTDAIDNSAGVDCSDHEVNIKILLNGEMNSGKLTLKARNKLLVEMTDEVARLVLRDNYQQTQTITQLQKRGAAVLEDQLRTMKLFERQGLLNREIEYLPSDEEIQERLAAGQGLSRPELSVFLPYGKMWLYDKIVASDLPDDPLVEEDLINYFPTKLRNTYANSIRRHKLRREIIATVITNSFVNRVGPSFLTNVMDRTGMGPVDIARAYTVTRAAYGLRDLWKAIESLDNKVPADTQMEMLLEITRMVERSVLWMLRHAPTPMNMAATIKKLKPGADELRKSLMTVCSDEVASYVKSRANSYIAKGVPKNISIDVATIYRLSSANEISTTAEATKQTQASVAKIYFLVGQRLGLDSLLARAESFSSGSHWDKLAVSAAIEELYGHQATITRAVISGAKTKSPGPKALDAWIARNAASIDRYDQVLAEVRGAEALSLSMLTVAIRHLNAMTG